MKIWKATKDELGWEEETLRCAYGSEVVVSGKIGLN